MRICFYAAVFSLFASVGVLVLLMSTTYVSPLQIVLNIVIIGGFAMAYAAVSIWQRYWLIPVLAICEGILFAFIGAHYQTRSPLIAPGSPLQRQLKILGVIGIVSVLLGYTLFVVFFATQARATFEHTTKLQWLPKFTEH
jgi:hypothetical protein